MTSNLLQLNVIADGGILERNPGGFGYGSFAIEGTILEQRQYGHENAGHTMTNIVSEILTCIEALNWIAAHVTDATRYAVTIMNDCQWVVKHLAARHGHSHKRHLCALHHNWLIATAPFASVKIRWHRREHSVAAVGH